MTKSIDERAADMAAANRQIEERIQQWGFETTNVRDNQIKFFVDFLVSIDVISHDDAIMYFLQWETHLNDTLAGLEIKAREAIADLRRKEKALRRAEERRLITPPSRSLLIPRNARRSSSNGGDGGTQPEG